MPPPAKFWFRARSVTQSRGRSSGSSVPLCQRQQWMGKVDYPADEGCTSGADNKRSGRSELTLFRLYPTEVATMFVTLQLSGYPSPKPDTRSPPRRKSPAMKGPPLFLLLAILAACNQD